jgi:hypothetical protein
MARAARRLGSSELELQEQKAIPITQIKGIHRCTRFMLPPWQPYGSSHKRRRTSRATDPVRQLHLNREAVAEVAMWKTEKRASPRARYVYADDGPRTDALRVRDISIRGASFYTAEPPPPGAALELELTLRNIPLTIEAEVVWRLSGNSFGVRFCGPTPGQTALVKDSMGGVTALGVTVRPWRMRLTA